MGSESSIRAQQTWNNTGADFNAGASWVSGTAPTTSAVAATFSTAPVTNPNVTASGTVAGVNFAAVSGYTLSGNAGTLLTLNSSAGITATNSTGTNTISANIGLGRSGAGGTTFSQANGGVLNISGTISSVSGATGVLSLARVAVNGGTFIFSASNTYSNGTSFGNSGLTLHVNNNSALGTGSLLVGSTVAGSTLDNSSGANVILTNNNALILSTSQAGTSSAANLTFVGAKDLNFGTGNITFDGAAARAISVTGAGVFTLGGNISQNIANSSLFKNGSGVLVLSGSSTYSGGTTVTAGTLLLNNVNNGGSATGSGAVQVNVGTLGGTGYVSGAVTVGNGTGSADSLLTPGATAASGVVGKFTTSSSLNLASDSKVVMDINATGTRGTNYDAIDVGTNLTFGGNLTLNITTGIGAGTYDLFAVTGTATQGLASMSFSGGQYVSTWAETSPTSGIWTSTSGLTSFTFDEATGDLVVAVPEPSSVILLGAGILLVLHKIRRRTLRA